MPLSPLLLFNGSATGLRIAKYGMHTLCRISKISGSACSRLALNSLPKVSLRKLLCYDSNPPCSVHQVVSKPLKLMMRTFDKQKYFYDMEVERKRRRQSVMAAISV